MKATVVVTSFGYLHGGPPPADITVDVRGLHFAPPKADRLMFDYLEGRDTAVRRSLLDTPAAMAVVDDTCGKVLALLHAAEGAPGDRRIDVAVGGTEGRYRSVAIAEEIGRSILLELLGLDIASVDGQHRDLDKAVPPDGQHGSGVTR